MGRRLRAALSKKCSSIGTHNTRSRKVSIKENNENSICDGKTNVSIDPTNITAKKDSSSIGTHNTRSRKVSFKENNENSICDGKTNVSIDPTNITAKKDSLSIGTHNTRSCKVSFKENNDNSICAGKTNVSIDSTNITAKKDSSSIGTHNSRSRTVFSETKAKSQETTTNLAYKANSSSYCANIAKPDKSPMCTDDTRCNQVSTKGNQERPVFGDKTNTFSHCSMALRNQNSSMSKHTPSGQSFINGVIQSPRTKISSDNTKLFSVRKLRLDRTPVVALERLEEKQLNHPKVENTNKNCIYTSNTSPICKQSQKLPEEDRLALYEFEVDENEPCPKKKKRKRPRRKKIPSESFDDWSTTLGSVIKKLRHLDTSSKAFCPSIMETCTTSSVVQPSISSNSVQGWTSMKTAYTKSNPKLFSSCVKSDKSFTSETPVNSFTKQTLVQHESQHKTSENTSEGSKNKCSLQQDMNDRPNISQRKMDVNDILNDSTNSCNMSLEENVNNVFRYVTNRRRRPILQSSVLKLTPTEQNLDKENSLEISCMPPAPFPTDPSHSCSKPVHQSSGLTYFSSTPDRKPDSSRFVNVTSKMLDNCQSTCAPNSLIQSSNLSTTDSQSCRFSEGVSSKEITAGDDLNINNCFGFDEEPEDNVLTIYSPVLTPICFKRPTNNSAIKPPFAVPVTSTPSFGKSITSKAHPTRISPSSFKPISVFNSGNKQNKPVHDIVIPSTSSTPVSQPVMIQPKLTFPAASFYVQSRKEKPGFSPLAKEMTKGKAESPPLFKDVNDDIPLHFNKPPRKSYERQSKRKLYESSMDERSTDEESLPEDEHPPRRKRKSNNKDKLEKKMAQVLTASFNSEFDKIDKHELCIEFSPV